MRNRIVFLFCLISISVSAQLADTSRYHDYISQRTINSLIYHVPPHKSPKFKITCRTALNRDALEQVIEDDNLSEAFDGIDFSQVVKYNLRVRWSFANNDKVYIGMNTMSSAIQGSMKNIFYIGFKKRF